MSANNKPRIWADINTNWGSHEPASILHELVYFHKNYEAMQYLIDRGIDMTTAGRINQKPPQHARSFTVSRGMSASEPSFCLQSA